MNCRYLTRGYEDWQSCCLIREPRTTGTGAGSKVGGWVFHLTVVVIFSLVRLS